MKATLTCALCWKKEELEFSTHSPDFVIARAFTEKGWRVLNVDEALCPKHSDNKSILTEIIKRCEIEISTANPGFDGILVAAKMLLEKENPKPLLNMTPQEGMEWAELEKNTSFLISKAHDRYLDPAFKAVRRETAEYLAELKANVGELELQYLIESLQSLEARLTYGKTNISRYRLFLARFMIAQLLVEHYNEDGTYA